MVGDWDMNINTHTHKNFVIVSLAPFEKFIGSATDTSTTIIMTQRRQSPGQRIMNLFVNFYLIIASNLFCYSIQFYSRLIISTYIEI